VTVYKNIIAIAFAAVIVAGFTGCGGSEFGLAPVSGTVTVDGQPLKNGYIGFSPLPKEGSVNAGRPSETQTDEQGRFVMKTVDSKDGAVIAEHKVWIRATPPSPGRDKIPARYNVDTELRYTVPAGGSSEADFDITTK